MIMATPTPRLVHAGLDEAEACGELFRVVMGRYPAAVSVITTAVAGEVAGMTATAVMSYSATPPSLLCSVGHVAQSHRLLEQCEVFAVNVLAQGQSDTAMAFARSDEGKFRRPELLRDQVTGVPLIADAFAHLICRRDAAFTHLDHTILVGRIATGEASLDRDPLVYAGRAFWRLAS